MADAQLALLHLAVGRLQRRAARPQPGQGGLGHGRRAAGARPSAWAAGRCAPAGVRPHLRPHGRGLRICQRHAAVLPTAGSRPAAGRRLGSHVRHQGHGRNDDGTRSTGENRLDAISGAKPTTCTRHEHNELFASIRSGKPINNGDYMASSTMMAIMGRMACYTGQTITWDQCLELEGRPDAGRSTNGARCRRPPWPSRA